MKRALIVDDSRLARHVLGQLLTEHGVEADTAESAEAALEYLKAQRPDVIFLDHLMPGMDGFEALEAIKTNPVTATIPVMMYTSKEGEVYLGQARALGALGVLPKNVQPVEVVKVLRSLHLIPADDVAGRKPQAASSGVALDARQLRALLAELFYEQNSTLRDELRRELQNAAATAASPPRDTATPEAVPLAVKRPRASIQRIGSVALLATTSVFAYLYFSTSALLTEAHDRTRTLASTATQLSAVTGGATPPARAVAPNRSTFEVLQWGVNQGGHFGFDEVPLDDARANVLSTLAEELDRLDFVGTVAVDVHLGRFCMKYGGDGALQLGAANEPATKCDEIGWPEAEAVALGQRESLAFAYALADVERRYPSVRIETASHGSSSPVTPYPSSYQATAGEWNAIAARNQRVEVRLLPALDGRR